MSVAARQATQRKSMKEIALEVYETLKRTRRLEVEGRIITIDNVDIKENWGAVSGWDVTWHTVAGSDCFVVKIGEDRYDRTPVRIDMIKPGVVVLLGLYPKDTTSVVVYKD